MPNSSQNKSVNTLEIILKITERCNIDCSYCYYFNAENNDFDNQPANIQRETIVGLVEFLNQAIEEHGFSEIKIDLHGGEPLLLGKRKFREIIFSLRSGISKAVNVVLSLQTNGTLVDDEWIDIFKEFRVRVGVSLDGRQSDNDRFRVDHKGKGTYELVAAAIRKLLDADSDGNEVFAGVICVVNPEFDGRETYKHFVEDLDVTRLHFPPPYDSRDNTNSVSVEGIVNYYDGVFEEWIRNRGRAVDVRQFSTILASLIAEKPIDKVFQKYVILTVRANGQMAVADEFRNAFPHLFSLDLNVKSHTLSDFLGDPDVSAFQRQQAVVPEQCQSCAIRKVCRSGAGFGESPLLRYSFANKFNNRSSLCISHQNTVVGLTRYLLERGVDWTGIEERLS